MSWQSRFNPIAAVGRWLLKRYGAPECLEPLPPGEVADFGLDVPHSVLKLVCINCKANCIRAAPYSSRYNVAKCNVCGCLTVQATAVILNPETVADSEDASLAKWQPILRRVV